MSASNSEIEVDSTEIEEDEQAGSPTVSKRIRGRNGHPWSLIPPKKSKTRNTVIIPKAKVSGNISSVLSPQFAFDKEKTVVSFTPKKK